MFKAIPAPRRGRPQGCETFRLQHFLDNRLTDGGEIVSLTRRPPLPSQEDSWYLFLLRGWTDTKAIVRLLLKIVQRLVLSVVLFWYYFRIYRTESSQESALLFLNYLLLFFYNKSTRYLIKPIFISQISTPTNLMLLNIIFRQCNLLKGPSL
jgi:hypothetical protein